MSSEQRFVLPPSDDEGREALARAATELGGTADASVPSELQRVLGLAASELAAGHAVAVLAYDTELTPGQAAELLGVSRSTVQSMIASGELPAADEGTRHTVALADLLAAQDRLAGSAVRPLRSAAS